MKVLFISNVEVGEFEMKEYEVIFFMGKKSVCIVYELGFKLDKEFWLNFSCDDDGSM